MNNKPLTLSIVIPVYNEQGYLKACLDSIAAQTHKPDEVIVVDNNSTDDSIKIASSYKFVKVISEKRQGIAFARNAGFNAARSDIIGRIDADTRLPSDWVARVIKEFVIPQCVALTGGGYFYNLHFPRLNGWVLGQIIFRFNRFIMGHYILWGSNLALSRNLWIKVRPETCLRNDIHEDLDLAIHIHRLGYPISYRESLKVGVYMKRVFSNPESLWSNLLLWPRTLKSHKMRRWVLGAAGAVLIEFLMPLLWLIEKSARLLYPDKKS